MVFGLIGVISFGLTLPATRFVIPYLDPVFIGLGRAVAAAIVALFILVLKRQPLPNLQQFKQLVFVALGVVIGFPVFSAWAMQSLPASHGGVVLGILPLATAAMAVLINNERPTLGFWLCGVAGSALVVIFSLRQGAGNLQFGDLLLVAAIISAAFGYTIGGKLAKEMGGWQVICWALLIALPVILIPTILTAPASFDQLPHNVVLCFAYLALVSQLFGFFFWYHGLALGGIARVSQAQLIQPFITLLASAYFLSEQASITMVIFALLVMLTVAVGKRMPIYKN